MITNPLRTAQIEFIVSLFLLASGSLSLRFHHDFFAGFGIFSGVIVIAMSAFHRLSRQ